MPSSGRTATLQRTRTPGKGGVSQPTLYKVKQYQSMEDLTEKDDDDEIPPWHRPDAPKKPDWVVRLLLSTTASAVHLRGGR